MMELTAFVVAAVTASLGYWFGYHRGAKDEERVWRSQAMTAVADARPGDITPVVVRGGDMFVVMCAGVFWSGYYLPLSAHRHSYRAGA